MPLLVALALLALACAPSETAPTPADVPSEGAADASAGPDGASDALPDTVPSDAGRTDAADGSVPDTLTDAPPFRDASRETGTPLCPEGMVWCGSFCSALNTTANCGGCGLQCCPGGICPAVPGGTIVCARMMCTYACDRSHLDCDGISNGCEAQIGNANCGGCGRRCDPGTTCAEGLMCCPSGAGGAACRDAALRAREDAGTDAG